MEEYITRAEHNEFSARIDSHLKRQDGRLEDAEKKIDEISRMNANIERLATSMESMQREQEKQGQRLDALEKRDGDMWQTVVKYAITAVLAAVVGYIFAQLGLG